MAGKWETVAPGIRCRDHAERKHGVKPDRYFTVRYMAGGKQVEEALGWASEGWTLKKAQAERTKLEEANRTGEGPATLREKRGRAEAQRQAEVLQAKGEKTVADLWDRYAKEVIAVHNKPRTIEEKTRMWENRVAPAIGHLKIKSVIEEHVGAVVRAPLRLAGGKVIGGKAEAGNLYRLLHHLFGKALAWGLRPKEMGNPLESIAEPKVDRRERLLTGGEIGALLRALDRTATEKTEQPQIVAIVRAAILTGARISELLSLEWDHVRAEEMEFHLPDTKSGFSRRPMSAETLAVLRSVDRMPGVPYIFRAVDTPAEPLAYNTAEKAFRRIVAAAGIERCSLHTIRHWFATMTANSVNNPRVGMALTGHKSHAAYMNYLHGDKAQAQALAGAMAALAGRLGEAETNVAPMRKGSGT